MRPKYKAVLKDSLAGLSHPSKQQDAYNASGAAIVVAKKRVVQRRKKVDEVNVLQLRMEEDRVKKSGPCSRRIASILCENACRNSFVVKMYLEYGWIG